MTSSNSHTQQVDEAFSRKAAIYDRFGVGHTHLTRMRHKVYDHLGRHLPPPATLLELNAGTGFDAVQLVGRGYRVHATDLAAGMVSKIEQKIATQSLDDRLSVERHSFTELEPLYGSKFDGIYSNFGGLNCIHDLSEVTRHFPHLLRPGGIATLVIMPPICPWELAVTIKDWRVGTRRLRPSGIKANVEGVTFHTTYFSVSTARRALGAQFEPLEVEGLSVVTPTADNDRFADRRPVIYQTLTAIDDHISGVWPFNRIGDFFILTMRFRP